GGRLRPAPDASDPEERRALRRPGRARHREGSRPEPPARRPAALRRLDPRAAATGLIADLTLNRHVPSDRRGHLHRNDVARMQASAAHRTTTAVLAGHLLRNDAGFHDGLWDGLDDRSATGNVPVSSVIDALNEVQRALRTW